MEEGKAYIHTVMADGFEGVYAATCLGCGCTVKVAREAVGSPLVLRDGRCGCGGKRWFVKGLMLYCYKEELPSEVGAEVGAVLRRENIRDCRLAYYACDYCGVDLHVRHEQLAAPQDRCGCPDLVWSTEGHELVARRVAPSADTSAPMGPVGPRTDIEVAAILADVAHDCYLGDENGHTMNVLRSVLKATSPADELAAIAVAIAEHTTEETCNALATLLMRLAKPEATVEAKREERENILRGNEIHVRQLADAAPAFAKDGFGRVDPAWPRALARALEEAAQESPPARIAWAQIRAAWELEKKRCLN